jgi:DNA polymerase I
MSTSTTTPQRNNTVEVDLKKTDYTIRDYGETEEIKQDVRDQYRNPEEIIDTIDDQGPGYRPVMHMLGRAAGGSRVHIRIHGVKPYFYVPFNEFGQELQEKDEVIGWEKGHENIQGDHMVKVYTRVPGDVPRVRGEYDHHEADILFPNRFLIDNDIEGSFRIPEEHATPEPTDLTVEQILEGDYNRTSRVCFCDIEVDNRGGFPDAGEADREVTCVRVYDNYVEDYQLFLYREDAPVVSHDKAKVRVFTDEETMLQRFNEYLNTRDFDAITGWNFSNFDSRYLVNRLDTLSDREDAEVSRSDISKLGSAYDDGEYFGAKIKGLSVVDMYKAYENLQFSELDSYRLEDVAQEELGVGKIKDTRSLYELWQNDVQKLVEYNVRDVELLVRLEEEQDIIKFYEEVANYSGGRLGEVVDVTKPVDLTVLRAVNGEYALPSAANVETDEFEGAKVFDPIRGLRQNVAVLDLASLYPMSMKTVNAGPETKDPSGELVAPNGTQFTTDRTAVVVDIIDELLEERQQYKDLRDQNHPDSKMFKVYDRKQSAVKVIMNTLYGVMGWDRFRLQDKDVGAAVTAVGRECIKFTEQVVEEMGYEVIYGDTDSVMVELGDVDLDDLSDREYIKHVLSEHDCETVDEFRSYLSEHRGEMSDDKFQSYLATMAMGFRLEERINERYDDFALDELNAEEHFFDIEFEKLYRTFFQAGKKKRYAGNITWKEGKIKDKLDIVGFEYTRSDYSKVAKQLFERVFDHILRGGTLQDLSSDVNDVIDKLRSEEYDPDEFGIPASVSQSFDEYDTMTPAAKGGQYANQQFNAGIQAGDKPKMNYVERILPDENGEVPYPMPDPDTSKSQPCCWMNYEDIPDVIEWNWDKYIENQIKKPIMRVLEGTDWTWQEVKTGDRQPRLGEYNFEDETANTGATVAEYDDGDGGDPLEEEFDSEDQLPWEEKEMEARRLLSETQGMLDDWDGEESEDQETSEADMTPVSEGPADLDTFM